MVWIVLIYIKWVKLWTFVNGCEGFYKGKMFWINGQFVNVKNLSSLLKALYCCVFIMSASVLLKDGVMFASSVLSKSERDVLWVWISVFCLPKGLQLGLLRLVWRWIFHLMYKTCYTVHHCTLLLQWHFRTMLHFTPWNKDCRAFCSLSDYINGCCAYLTL